MNSLYFNQTRSLFASFFTVLVLLMTLFIIAQSAQFLTFAIEVGLNASIFLQFVGNQIPVQLTALLPICLVASAASTFGLITISGEYSVLRSAGISEHSFFVPALKFGFAMAALYAVFSFEIAPRAFSNLRSIETRSDELDAQNTLINQGDVTLVGSLEIFVQETNDATLDRISFFAPQPDQVSIFANAQSAQFLDGPNGLALNLQDGQILRDINLTPQEVQVFEQLQVDLASALARNESFPAEKSTQQLSLSQLFSTRGKSDQRIREHRAAAGKRLSYTFLIFAVPSWTLLWHLITRAQRGRNSLITYIGPISLALGFLALETPLLANAHTWMSIGANISGLMLIALIGPVFFLFRNLRWQARRPNAPMRAS